jgi:hypothetical protein
MVRERTPRTLGEYMHWFADRWHAEMPTEIHGGGVFFGPPDRDGRSTLGASESRPSELVGGSLLGSPRERDPFRRLMEDGPFAVQYGSYDGHGDLEAHYVFPLRAALARISHHRPTIARWLFAVAYADFDWPGVADRRGFDIEEAEFLLTQACYLLFRECDIAPRVRETRGAVA